MSAQEFTPGMCPNCARMVAQLQRLSRLLEEIAYLASTHHVRAAEPPPALPNLKIERG